jgi:LCP family protein required for cell wall assembly
MNPHPHYVRGTRLRADEVRRARQGVGAPPGAAAAAASAVPGGMSRPRTYGAPRGGSARAQSGVSRPRPAIRRRQTVQGRVVSNRRPWSLRKKLVIGIPGFLFVVALAIAVPLALQAREAANKIFVDPDKGRVIVTQNAEGTTVAIPASQSTATAPIALPDIGKERVNILLLGVDDRKDGEVARSDTMILVTVDPVAKKVAMLSIPRDLLVTIPNYGKDKINAAYAYGSTTDLTGAGLARATVEYNFGITIQYFAEVDFTGFQKIVDTLGGVTMDVASPIKDDEYPADASNYTRVYFHTGLQHMNGQQALRYARTRHDDNDFARGSRQQEVLRALREQGVQLGLITKAPQLISALGDTVRTDMSPTQALALARLGNELKSEDITSYSMLSAVTEQYGEVYYLVPNWNAVHAILNQMTGGDTAGASASSGGQAQAATPTPSKPNFAAPILVQNATRVNLLATNSSNLLIAAGFTDVTPAQSPSPGEHPKSQIVDYSGNPATARRVAEILNLPQTIIKRGDPAESPDYDVVVTLGEDAPVPTPRP